MVNKIFEVFLVCFVVFLSAYVKYQIGEINTLKVANKDLSTTVVELQEVNSELNKISEGLTEEVKLRQDLVSLIVDASRSYNIDPKLYASLIKSESNFRPNIKHAVPHVVGMAAINLKAHKALKYNPHGFVGNIYAGAEVLSTYLADSDSLTLGLTRYKGLSPLGYSQAKDVVKEYCKWA